MIRGDFPHRTEIPGTDERGPSAEDRREDRGGIGEVGQHRVGARGG